MLLIFDLPIYQKPDFSGYVRALGLPSDTEVLSSLPDGSIGKRERVVYVTSLESGGKKRQKDLILDNKDVDEWLVLSEGTEDYLLELFAVSVDDAAGAVRLCSSVEEAAEALRKPVKKRKSCLICSLSENEYIKPFSELLQSMLPSWSVGFAVLEHAPDALDQCTAGTILLLGGKPIEFRFRALPEGVRPLIVLTGMERQPYAYLHRLPRLRRQIFGSMPFLQWGESLRNDHFYMVCPFYEQLRIRYEQESIPTAELKKQDSFVMWDEFGLPMPPSVYEDRQFIRVFLSQFTGCQELARRLGRA